LYNIRDMSVLDSLPRPFFVLAPMDDVTDSVFRRVVAQCAPPDLFFTEFVNVDGLQSPGRHKLMKKLKVVSDTERPVIAQLWGKEPDNFRNTADELVSMGFAGVDLNMGCPAKSEVQNGTCSALIKNRPLAQAIIEATKDGLMGRLPLSVKTRVGFNEVDMTWISFLLEQKIDMLTVHGRTRKQMSKVPANWDLIGEAVHLRDGLGVQTLIVGNGDVRDRAHGLELAERYRLDGIMIGRGVFQDPYAFAEVSPWETVGREERLRLFENHVRMFDEAWRLPPEQAYEDGRPRYERAIHTLNKFCKIYINGFDGAKELRERLMAANSADELIEILAYELQQDIPHATN
jgi:tRNA-dihydrouridine synthase